MKKLLFLFTLGFCSLGAWAESFNSADGKLKFTITGTNEVSVAKGTTKPTGALEIPSSVIYNSITYTVTSIGDNAFKSCSGLTSVTIPNSVTDIGSQAFYSCSGLTSVTIGNSVTSIDNDAFSGCIHLTSVNYTGTIEDWCGINFGNYDAQPCYGGGGSLYINGVLQETITIPNSVTTIGNNAFAGCSGLTSVTIPNSVTTIGTYAFAGCSGLTSVTIPNSVTTIGTYAFAGCRGLTSVTIPNSVISIGSQAFYNCRGLTSVTIPNSVTSIGTRAFYSCSNLFTIYNLSSLSITNNDYGLNANRVVKCIEHSGSGDNIIYKIPTSYSIVDDEDYAETHIPRSTIPTNFIYKDGSVWKAKNIVLTDGQDTFAAPETFTAETATYTREFTNSNRSTLYLPFTAAIPEEDFEVYDFTSFANNTISFTKREDSIYAYTPYLVGYELSKDGNTTTCTITKNNAVFPKSESANYNPVTHEDMTFSGVISRTQMTSTNNYGYSNGFFVQSGGSAHVNPFRCYFTYTPSGNAPQSLPPTLNVEVGYGDPVGIGAVETPEQEYDGRYGKDVYDMLGRLVRKNADNLEGLPRGIYIWKGKKHFNN